MTGFIVLTDGRTSSEPGLPLQEAARRVAAGYASGARVEARVEASGRRSWRPLTKKETEALAYAAALEVEDA